MDDPVDYDNSDNSHGWVPKRLPSLSPFPYRLLPEMG